MKIMQKDKESFQDYDEFEIISGNVEIIAENVYGIEINGVVVEYYKTFDRAKEVLQMLLNACGNGDKTFTMPED